MELPRLPDVPDDCPVTAKLVESIRLLRLDDDFGTLDMYVGKMDTLVSEAMLSLERRIVELSQSRS